MSKTEKHAQTFPAPDTRFGAGAYRWWFNYYEAGELVMRSDASFRTQDEAITYAQEHLPVDPDAVW